MGFGILDPATTEKVPGTALLAELGDPTFGQLDSSTTRLARRLKHGTGKNSHILLVPQPSDDPNDPLVSSIHVGAPIHQNDLYFA
jgi:hypothetical protein